MLTEQTIVNFLLGKRENVDELIYNEASLQFELVTYLRNHQMIAKIERHIKKDGYLEEKEIENVKAKKVIDIVVEDETGKIAIELKCPLLRAKKVSKAMFNYAKDLKFLEELSDSGKFERCYSLILTNDKDFWEGDADSPNPIYSHFRNHNKRINIEKTILFIEKHEEKSFVLRGHYQGEWNKLNELENANDRDRLFHYIVQEVV